MSSVPLFVLLRICLLVSILPVFLLTLYIRVQLVISLSCIYRRVVTLNFMLLVMKRGGGG